ncbi:hypothetical protein P3T76_001644 [Phytophthora citrophthora]|uniref:Uncharacterized protein n=1 Tax=Phytophthora citrophthora TaxID=4793 RepID=A0AAD9LUY1_9STRA|nr:hypothetical protein P3T76_001644 [Phytophthora citrophthora]
MSLGLADAAMLQARLPNKMLYPASVSAGEIVSSLSVDSCGGPLASVCVGRWTGLIESAMDRFLIERQLTAVPWTIATPIRLEAPDVNMDDTDDFEGTTLRRSNAST